MKRIAALVMVACLAGCAETSTSSSVSLPGPNAVVVSGRTLLVASTANDELRALDLKASPRAFVRAPNPLFPLAIPTQPFPRALASYTNAEGAASPFSFALSTAGAQVTVVSNATLAPLGSMAVPDTTLAVAVTAPDSGEERLVMAATLAGSGTLWAARFSASLQADPTAIAAIEPVIALSLGDSIPEVLVASPVDPNLVAVGDRRTGQGALALCDLASGKVTRVDVGGPIQALSFDRSGGRLYGLLNSEACGGSEPCGGAFVVDLSDPTAPTLAGTLTIPGAAQGLAVGAEAVLTLSSGATKTVDPLVVVSSTTGSLYLVDGATLSNPGPQVTSFYRLDSSGTRTDNPTAGPQILDSAGGIVLTPSTDARTETLTLTFEGVVASGGTGSIDVGALVDPVADFSSVQVGDLVVFGAADGCASATAEVVATSTGRLALDAGFDASCLPVVVQYEVRAAGAFVVVGSVSGGLGRVAVGQTFSGAGVSFLMGAGTIARGDQYLLTLLAEFVIPVASSTTTLSMPGAAAFDPLGKLFYVAFAGGSALLEVNPADVRSGKVDVGLVTFR